MTRSPITQTATPSAKISLFRSLFKGREDIYPQRFESRKTGKAGYSPACGNEWVRGICEKPKIKCSEYIPKVIQNLVFGKEKAPAVERSEAT